MLSDIEIASQARKMPIAMIAEKLGLNDSAYDCYGKYKAKITVPPRKNRGRLILVTAMNPTPLGEGKTTVSIGLADGMSLMGKKVCLALREPSLGPVFGIKGGACGGGYSQVIPMEDINLHFNGDFHAITYANDLLSALIDNHIMQGNELHIAKVVWKRCLDLNDRALRQITVAQGENNGVERSDGFTITAASEIMAILCLCSDLSDLKRRLGNILIGYSDAGKEIFASDLKAQDSMAILLKDAIRPNLVQTLEGTPALVHGGPFANIAHGCNSVIATKTALGLADYVITEAGFGAELGAEKFYDIKCRKAELNPDCAVLVITLRSIKYNAGIPKEETSVENKEALLIGFANVKRHITNLKKVFGQKVIVALNRFPTDTNDEIEYVKSLCIVERTSLVVSNGFSEGGKGCLELAETVVNTCVAPTLLNYAYELNMTIEDKIFAVASRVYGTKDVIYSEKAKETLKTLKAYESLPICIAKTQYSFSSDMTLFGAPSNFTLEVQDLHLRRGAEFIVVQCGKILLMPGLSKTPSALKMKISDNGTIKGLF